MVPKHIKIISKLGIITSEIYENKTPHYKDAKVDKNVKEHSIE